MTTDDIARLTDAQVLGLTGAGEARAMLVPGHGWQPAPLSNMIAVMCTSINRVKANPARFGADVSDVCFEHAQYSCWNARSGSNHDWLMSQAAAIVRNASVAPVVRQCITAAEQLLAGTIPDAVHGATYYYSPLSMVPAGRVPIWARGKVPCATIGDQFVFFKNI